MFSFLLKQNNIIKVGKGNVVGMETFLTWNDQNPHPVNYVAFATGWGSTGKWKVMRGINLFQCMLSVIKIIIQKFKFFISHSRVHRGHRYKIQIQLTDNNIELIWLLNSENINILTEICGFLLDSHCISDK
jgi:hypothetical protein